MPHPIQWKTLCLPCLLVLAGCGGTWVDDEGNFARVFGFSRPQDVEVVHSVYWKSAHWSSEYYYFIALRASPKFLAGLTSAESVTPVASEKTAADACGEKPPEWFMPKSVNSYEAWVPKAGTGYRVFRDRTDGTLFLCDERL